MPLVRPAHLNAPFVISFVVGLLLACSFASLQARCQKAAFFTRQHRYRFGRTDPQCSKDNHCNLEIPPSRDYSLNFIEFKDDGTPYDQAQINAALDQIHAAQNSNDSVLVFIYIHGWHNSAEERTDQPKNPNCGQRLYTGDVDKFRHCGLEIFAKNPPFPPRHGAAPAAPRIVGIYLAWRGWDFGWPPLSWVPSYYLRMPKARSIGLIGMNDALKQIFKAIDPKKPHLTIAMGHSFGARALEAALDGLPKGAGSSLQKGILQGYREKASDLRIGPDPLPVDLVFYVNAATSNADTIRTQKSWDSTCQKNKINGCNNNPLYFAVSSHADLLTEVLMPFANLLAMPVGFALRGPNYDNGYHLISAANTPWMQTHKIPVQTPVPAANAPKEGFCFAVPAKHGPDLTYVVETKPRKTPSIFWIMNSDHWSAAVQGQWIISKHADVWNAGVFNMVRSLIDTQDARINHPSEPVLCQQQTEGQH